MDAPPLLGVAGDEGSAGLEAPLDLFSTDYSDTFDTLGLLAPGEYFFGVSCLEYFAACTRKTRRRICLRKEDGVESWIRFAKVSVFSMLSPFSASNCAKVSQG